MSCLDQIECFSVCEVSFAPEYGLAICKTLDIQFFNQHITGHMPILLYPDLELQLLKVNSLRRSSHCENVDFS